MDKWTSWYWKRQENSPFCVRTLSTSENAIFWVCLHSWPFGRALQLLISQEAIRVCPVPRHYFPSQAFPWGFKLYNFSSGLVTERSNLLSQPNSFVSFVSITDPGSDVKEQGIWSILTFAWLSTLSLTTLSQVNSGILDWMSDSGMNWKLPEQQIPEL